MKTLTLDQLSASLVAVGAKSIETRSWRTDYRGPLAIHAGAKRPASWTVVGDYKVRGFGRTGLALEGPGLPKFRDRPRVEGYLLPLGAVVASATLIDCLRIVDRWPSADPKSPDYRTGGLVYSGQHGLALWRGDAPPFPSENIVHEAPFGDFSPGMFAWLLGDVKPTTERCPWCAGTGVQTEGVCDEYAAPYPCSVCEGRARCEPVPVRGKQGLWEWDSSRENAA